MKIVVRKSLYKEYYKNHNEKVYYIIIDGDLEINKSWNSAVHPRDPNTGRFSEKGVMELTEDERKELLELLEKEKYVKYKGIWVSERKISAIKSGKYKEEFKDCKKLQKLGFEMYMLGENYVKGSKSDTFYKKNSDVDFLELKNCNLHKLIKRFNESKVQAPSVFISLDEKITYSRYKDLKKKIQEDVRNGYVIINYKNKCKIIKNKQFNETAPAEEQ